MACARAHESGRSSAGKAKPPGTNVRIERGITMDLVKTLTEQYMKPELPQMNVGDTVRVTVRVKEGNRVRNQAFDGTIIAKKHGGINETITVRRISYGVGCEKVFPVHSPTIHRLRRDGPPRQGPPREAVLPARPRGQEGQGQGAHLNHDAKQSPLLVQRAFAFNRIAPTYIRSPGIE